MFIAVKRMLRDQSLPPAHGGQCFIVDRNGQLKLELIHKRLAPRAESDDNSLNDFNTGTPHSNIEGWIAALLKTAVQHVGWVPRDIYHFVAEPVHYGMFSILGAV